MVTPIILLGLSQYFVVITSVDIGWCNCCCC